MAKAVADKLGGKGKFIILEGPAGASNAIERLNGINTGLSEYEGIEIVLRRPQTLRGQRECR